MTDDLFVDTLYLVARLNPKDQWHKAALSIDPLIKGRHLVTTETVLIELLNYLAEFPPEMREAVGRFVKLVLNGFLVEVVFTRTAHFCKVWNFTKIVLIKVTV